MEFLITQHAKLPSCFSLCRFKYFSGHLVFRYVVYVVPSKQETMFHNHIKWEAVCTDCFHEMAVCTDCFHEMTVFTDCFREMAVFTDCFREMAEYHIYPNVRWTSIYNLHFSGQYQNFNWPGFVCHLCMLNSMELHTHQRYNIGVYCCKCTSTSMTLLSLEVSLMSSLPQDIILCSVCVIF
jgi:hypothetical protein